MNELPSLPSLGVRDSGSVPNWGARAPLLSGLASLSHLVARCFPAPSRKINADPRASVVPAPARGRMPAQGLCVQACRVRRAGGE